MQEFASHIPITEEELKPLASDERLLHIMTKAGPLGMFRNMDLNHMKRYVEIARNHTRACLLYKPMPYAGRIVLFKTDTGDHADTNHGWDDLALLGLDVLRVPGTHLNMLEPPHVQFLATHLERHLSCQSTKEQKIAS
jgi:thioesterase domain-containing protein